MKQDIIEIICDSIIQHGKNSNRVYIMKIGTKKTLDLIKSVNELAEKNSYSKIFAKIPSAILADFSKDGYVREAFIKGYYNGQEDALLMCKYLSEERSILKNSKEIESIISMSKSKKNTSSVSVKKKQYEVIICSKQHAQEMANIYKLVFESYPFPIHDPHYIEKTMDDNVIYFGAVLNNKVIALASSEVDKEAQSVEMTDFATLPEHLGNGIACQLLKHMENHMIDNNIITSYTIARAESLGMNITFARNGYEYSGTLINNTHISGKIESMNVWFKTLHTV
ncbi:MAG: putative beta-lysine N-acetyltransferase [Endomicrobiaceae bacterium]|nr:putative beta-lysine N-acetyltransferase [Endomicrobiaceae bacterium]